MEQPTVPQPRKINAWVIIAITVLVSAILLFFQNRLSFGPTLVETETGESSVEVDANASTIATNVLYTPLPDLDALLQSLPQTATPFPGPAVPARIEIEAVQIDVLVLTVSLDSTGFIEVPDRYAAYWGASSPLGKNGNTVIVGHNRLEPSPIFNNLDDVKKGDQIRVTDQFGEKHLFVVTETLLFKVSGASAEEANRPREYAMPTTTGRLTLITCAPDDTCTSRLVVLAEPVSQQ
jgi:LPXTG-site transpeptidase (sortase) family protein